MKTNFFQSIAEMQVQGDWKITIKTGEAGALIVSVLLSNDKADDEARKRIPPMLFNGPPEEIDASFFATIAAPAKETAALLTNMAEYAKQLEEAKKHSKMEQDKDSKEKKEKEERKKKYDAQMKKVDELEEGKKIHEAIANLPKEKDYPEHVEDIKKRLEELRKKNAQLSLM